jgi:hypothetical protein
MRRGAQSKAGQLDDGKSMAITLIAREANGTRNATAREQEADG